MLYKHNKECNIAILIIYVDDILISNDFKKMILIGRLIYLSHDRPDIAFGASMVSIGTHLDRTF